MPATFRVRTTLYSLALFFGICESVFALLAAMFNDGIDPDSSPTFAFIVIAIVLAFATWILSSVLLSYNDRPTSSNRLTTFRMHFTIYTVLFFGQLLAAALVSSRIPMNCEFDKPSDGLVYTWCTVVPGTSGLAWLQAILCGTTAFMLWHASRRANGGLSANVTAFDKPRPYTGHGASAIRLKDSPAAV